MPERYACLIDVRSFLFQRQESACSENSFYINPHLTDLFDALSSQLVQSRLHDAEIEFFVFGREEEFDLQNACYRGVSSIDFSDIDYLFYLFKNEYRLGLLKASQPIEHDESHKKSVSQEICDSLWQIVDDICDKAEPSCNNKKISLFSTDLHFLLLPKHLTHLAKELSVSTFSRILFISDDGNVISEAEKIGCQVCPTYQKGALNAEDVHRFYVSCEKESYTKLMVCFGGQSLFSLDNQERSSFNESVMALIFKLQSSRFAYSASYSAQNIFDNDQEIAEHANLENKKIMNKFFEMLTFMMYHDSPFQLSNIRIPELWQGVLRLCHLSVLLEVGRMIVYIEPDLDKAKRLTHFITTKIPRDLQRRIHVIQTYEKGAFPRGIIDLVPKWLSLDVPMIAVCSSPREENAEEDFDDCDSELPSKTTMGNSMQASSVRLFGEVSNATSNAVKRFTSSVPKFF